MRYPKSINGKTWHDIAEAIRSKRFSDIPDEAWLVIADKIDDTPNKRGPKPKSYICKDGSIDFNFKRGDETSYQVIGLYEIYMNEGFSSSQAKQTIVSKLHMSIKTVEKYVTAYKKGLAEVEQLNRERELEEVDD